MNLKHTVSVAGIIEAARRLHASAQAEEAKGTPITVADVIIAFTAELAGVDVPEAAAAIFPPNETGAES